MLRGVRSIGSGAPSNFVKTERTLGWGWVVLIVFIVLQSLILRCAFVPNEWGLLGGKSNLFGRYTSTRTLHVLQVPSVNALLAAGASVPAVPSHWNSLGMTIPFEDETYLQTNAVRISKVYTPPTTEFIDPGKTGTFYNRCNRMNTNHLDGVFHPQCELEHLQNAALITNGDSMSVLTEITPGLYMITLLTIYWLSIVQWTADSLAVLVERCGVKTNMQKLFSTALYTLIGVWYFVIIVNAFADLNRMYLLDMLGSSVYFRVTSHLPSLLVNMFVLLLYILHLRGRHLSFGYTQYEDVATEETQAIEHSNVNPIVIPNPKAQAQAAPFTQQQMHLNMTSFGMHGPTGPKFPSIYKSKAGGGDGAGGGDAAGNGKGMRSCVNDMLKQCFGDNCCVPNMSGLDATWNADYKHGNKHHGPVTSEASVLLAVTLVLGGIACASIGRGMAMEIDIQSALVAVLAYSLLEVAMQKVLKYYEYMKQHYSELFESNASYVVFAFVRAVVLFLQSIILVIWSDSMNNINSRENAIFMCIYVVTWIYWACRLVTLVSELFAIFKDECICCSVKSADFTAGVYWVCEFLWPILLLTIVVIAVFARSDNGNSSADNKHEQTVLKYDKILYGKMYDVDTNAACGSNFQSSSLLYTELVNEFNKNDDKTPKVMYKDPYDDVSETFTTLDRSSSAQNFTAVDMKVFYWTRRWRQHSARPVSANTRYDSDLFFCTAGFERHWGICKSALTEHEGVAWAAVTSLPADVVSKIPEKTKWYLLANDGDGTNHGGKNKIEGTLQENDKY